MEAAQHLEGARHWDQAYDLVLVRLQVSFAYVTTSLSEASFFPTYRIEHWLKDSTATFLQFLVSLQKLSKMTS